MLFAMLPFISTFAISCGKSDFMGLVPWYEYLTVVPDSAGGCKIVDFDNTTLALGSQSPFLLIGLAILEDLIRLAGLIAVGYIIYGGFQYMTSQGAPDTTKKAQQTIINALVGVAIALIAGSGVAYLGHRLGSY